MKLIEIIKFLESIAPKEYAKSFDNVGLMVGNPNADIQRVLIALDVIPEIVDNAIEKKVDLIISHHPLIFRPLSSINLSSEKGKIIEKCIKSDIAVYSAHTNLDSVRDGVNFELAEVLGLTDVLILQGEKNLLYKVILFVPGSHLRKVRDAAFAAGAGNIGDYSGCSFSSNGTGTFKGNDKTKPYIGKPGEFEEAEECKLEFVVHSPVLGSVIGAIKQAHPYEEPAVDVIALSNINNYVGLGCIGKVEPINCSKFIGVIKEKLQAPLIKVSGDVTKKISKVALCGGSGASLAGLAKSKGADAYISANIDYHTILDYRDSGMVLIDAGHYYTEFPIVHKLKKLLGKFAGELDISIYMQDYFSKTVRYF